MSPACSIQKKIDRFHRIHRLHSLRQGVPSSVGLFRPRDTLKRVSLQFQLPSPSRVDALFKPQQSDKRAYVERTFHIRAGTATSRERAAYLTAWHLGLHQLVPQTELATERSLPGSLQQLVQGRNLAHDFTVAGSRERALKRVPWEDIYALAVFDFVTCQLDRKPYNVFLRPVGQRMRVVAIDNELSFPASSAPRLDAYNYLAGSVARLAPPVAPSTRLIRRIKKVNISAWKADLYQVGLVQPEVEAAVRRLERLQREGLGALFGGRTDPHGLVQLWDRTARGL